MNPHTLPMSMSMRMGVGGSGVDLLNGLEHWWDLDGGDASHTDQAGGGWILTKSGTITTGSGTGPGGQDTADNVGS